MNVTQPGSNSVNPNPATEQIITRREFLKLSAFAAAGGALMTVSPLSFMAKSKYPLLELDNVLEDVLRVCSNSPLYVQAIDELAVQDFQFECSVDTIEQASIQEPLLGAVLRPTTTCDPRMGAAISLTFDLQDYELNVLEYIMVWCLFDLVNVLSVSFDRWKPLFSELRSQRLEYPEPPRMIRPRIENRWSFTRENPLPLLPEDVVMEGWPPLAPERKYWFFDGISREEWLTREEITSYRCMQISECMATGLDQTIVEQRRFLDILIPP